MTKNLTKGAFIRIKGILIPFKNHYLCTLKQNTMAGFFHTPKAKRYNVTPRYWDPEKEEREARYRRSRAKAGVKDENGEFKPYIPRGEFKRGLSDGKWSVKNQRRKSTTRLLLLLAIMAVLVFLMLR